MSVIAIPMAGNQFSAHFGAAEAFAFFTVDDETDEVVGRRVDTPPEHGHGVFPMWLKAQGATVVLAGGMGPRASTILNHHGIEVLVGVEAGDLDAMVKGYLAGTLRVTGSYCMEPGFHDCGHHHG